MHGCRRFFLKPEQHRGSRQEVRHGHGQEDSFKGSELGGAGHPAVPPSGPDSCIRVQRLTLHGEQWLLSPLCQILHSAILA